MSSGTLGKTDSSWRQLLPMALRVKLEIVEPECPALCSVLLSQAAVWDWPARGEPGRHWVDWVAFPISGEIREGCCPYHVSPIYRSNSLLFCVPVTMIPRSSAHCWTRNKQQCRGCSLIIPWEGKPESQHWLVKFLAEGLGFLGREEVTICLQALSSLPPPTAELTVSLIGGFGCQAFWQAPSCHLKPTERRIVLFQVLRVRGTWPLLLGHREIKSAL